MPSKYFFTTFRHAASSTLSSHASSFRLNFRQQRADRRWAWVCGSCMMALCRLRKFRFCKCIANIFDQFFDTPPIQTFFRLTPLLFASTSSAGSQTLSGEPARGGATARQAADRQTETSKRHLLQRRLHERQRHERALMARRP